MKSRSPAPAFPNARGSPDTCPADRDRPSCSGQLGASSTRWAIKNLATSSAQKSGERRRRDHETYAVEERAPAERERPRLAISNYRRARGASPKIPVQKTIPAPRSPKVASRGRGNRGDCGKTTHRSICPPSCPCCCRHRDGHRC